MPGHSKLKSLFESTFVVDPSALGAVAQCHDNHKCVFHPECSAEKGDKNCSSEDTSSNFSIGAQPVLRVEIEAHGEGLQVSNISIFFTGEKSAAVEAMLKQLGKPLYDTAKDMEESWSRTRRLFWSQDEYRITLIDNPQMILIARN